MIYLKNFDVEKGKIQFNKLINMGQLILLGYFITAAALMS